MGTFIVVPDTQGAQVQITQLYLQITPMPASTSQVFTKRRLPRLRFLFTYLLNPHVCCMLYGLQLIS